MPRPPYALPSFQTTFIGRKHELTELKRLLMADAAAACRLLTLTGPGGSGKTRLAVRLAFDLLPHFPEGIWHVELAALADPALIPQAVSHGLGQREQPGQALTDLLTDYLQSRRALLILDNCEHLLAACAALATTLLDACPDLHILATSRVRLTVDGETVWTVPALSLPPLSEGRRQKAESSQTGHNLLLTPHASRPPYPASHLKPYESVQLFVTRAQDVLRRFKLTDDNALYVARICRQLEGIPLAIELAAARVKILSVEQIAERLDDALRLLTLDGHTEARHHTLRATLDWSHDLLSPQEQILLRRLSVFAGGFTIEAAEAVASNQMPVDNTQTHLTPDDTILPTDILDLLTFLVDKSLVEVMEREPGPARYRLLEPIRQFAAQKLEAVQETNERRQRHAKYYLTLAEAAEPQLKGADQIDWLDRLEQEHDNFRAALGWCRESGEVEWGLRLAGALWWFWALRSHYSEGQSHLQAILRLPDGHAMYLVDEPTGRWRAMALCALGGLAVFQGNLPKARPSLEESAVLAQVLDFRYALGNAWQFLGHIAYFETDLAEADRLFKASLSIFYELNDEWNQTYVLLFLTIVAMDRGDVATARSLLEERRMPQHHPHDPWLTHMLLNILGDVTRSQGDYAQSVGFFEQAATLSERLGYREGVATCRNNAAFALTQLGQHQRAEVIFRQNINLVREIGSRREMTDSLAGLAMIAAATGHTVMAARLGGSVVALRETLQCGPLQFPERDEFEESLAQVRTALGDAAFAAAWAEGCALSLEEAIALASDVMTDDGRSTTEKPLPQSISHKEGDQLSPVRRSASVGLLTRREREVAALVAAGLISDDIAAQLYVSVKTVEKHIGNILGKLGYARRAQIAAWSVEHGLAEAPPDLDTRLRER